MKRIKFTSVKLIVISVPLIFFIILFSAKNGLARQSNTNQVAASKTGQEIQKVAPNDSIHGNFANYFVQKVLSKDKLHELKKRLLDYGNNFVPLWMMGFYFTMVEASFQFPVILIFMAIILFLLLNITSVFLILNVSVKRKNYKERYWRIYSKMYEEVLLSYLFQEINWEKASTKLKRKGRKENRKILISILLNFHENLKGEVDKFIPEIFLKLNLQKDSLRAAKSFFDYKKVHGIRELTFLYPAGARGIISGLINERDDNVRAEAQIAFIMLNPEAPFKFFLSLKKPFTRWTQLSAFNLLRLHQLPIPPFADFLYSRHPNIQNFSLRMINYYQQFENISEIFKMLESKMETTRFLVFKAINDLRLYDGRELVKNKYWIESGKNKLEIIRAIRNIGDENDFDFLTEIIRTEPVSFKIEACRSMYFMNSNGREQLLKMKGLPEEEIKLLIEHVTDPRN